MLNLLDFKPGGGAERYDEYARGGGAAARARRGAGSSAPALGSAALLGPSKWDAVALVEYPTRGAFLEMVSSPEYLEIAHLRTEALERSELAPARPGPGRRSP